MCDKGSYHAQRLGAQDRKFAILRTEDVQNVKS